MKHLTPYFKRLLGGRTATAIHDPNLRAGQFSAPAHFSPWLALLPYRSTAPAESELTGT